MYRVGFGDTPTLLTTRWCASGRTGWLTNMKCWGRSLADWQALDSAVVAAPPGPSDLLMNPAEHNASADISVMVNEQMRRQQALNAAGVVPVGALPGASFFIGVNEALNPANWKLPALNWWLIGGLGIGAFALITIAQPGARRYGR